MLGKLQSHLQRENESHTTGPSTMPIASDVITATSSQMVM